MALLTVVEGDIFRSTATFLTDGVDITQWVWNYEAATGGATDVDVLNEAVAFVLRQAWQIAENDIIEQVAGSVLELAKYDPSENKWNTLSQVAISDLVGADVGSYLPLGVALLVKFISTRAKALGKKFMFGQNENAIDDGQFDVGAVANALSFAVLFLSPANAGTVFLVAGAFNQAIVSFNMFTGAVFADANASYQRRRKPGVGL